MPRSFSGRFVLLTAGVLYFSEGLPFGLVNELFPLYLRTHGVALAEIGMLSAVGFIWTAKILWAPLIDRLWSYRTWMSGALVVLVATTVAFVAGGSPLGIAFWILVTLMVTASATQDIAIDAYTITITPSRLLGPVNSIRVTTYRIAMILAGGGLAVVATVLGWRVAFGCAAFLFVVLLAFTRTLPSVERGNVEHVEVIGGVRRWLNRPDAALLVALVLLYRLGDSAIIPMIKPFWIDNGFSVAEVGSVTTGAGILLTIAGAWAGGWVVARKGIFRALLWLGIAQAASNAGYALLATTHAGRAGFYAAAVIENFSGGLGTAAFLAFLMRLCDKEFAATEYAILSALFAFSRSAAGAVSGELATVMGYAGFFWLTLLLGAPGIALLIWKRGAFERAVVEKG